MSQSVRIGIIGAGRIGAVHARALCTLVKGAEVVAISDVVAGAAEKVASEFGIPKAVSDHREILKDASVDAVFICSSTDTHADLIVESAEAGKHIFCEKPVALDIAKIRQALAAVDKHGVKLMVGFNRRFDAGNMRLREAVVKGEIGVPEMCVINSRDPAPPPIEYVKVSGGIFLDMMIHDFDLCRFLVGDEPEEVYAAASCLVDKRIGELGDSDTAMVTIRFKNGALCHIDNSRRAVYGYDQRTEVFGSLGKVFTMDIHNNNSEIALVDGYKRPPIQNFFLERYLPAYQEEGRVFVDCVLKGQNPPTTGQDGLMSVLMGYAAMKSLKEKRAVKISEVE